MPPKPCDLTRIIYATDAFGSERARSTVDRVLNANSIEKGER